MNFHNAAGPYTRATVKYGVRRQTRTRRSVNLSFSLDNMMQIGKVVIWVLPVLLVVNLMCSSAISSLNHSMGQMQTVNVELEKKNVELLARKAMVGSEANVRELAGKKLGLQDKTEGQVGVFSRRSGTFQYN